MTRPVVACLAEPARMWIGARPRHWPSPEAPWIDLAAARLGSGAAAVEADARLLAEPLAEPLYLPPVAAADRPWRDRVAAAHLGRGTAVVLQVLPGEPAPPAGATAVLDPLPALLAGELPAVPPGLAAAVWAPLPVPPGLAGVWARLPGHLAAAGLEVLQAIAVELSPADRRRLGERFPEEESLAAFHATPPPIADLDRRAVAAGLRPLLERPLPAGPPGDRRRLAGLLALAAELSARRGEPAGATQELWRAARELEASRFDFAALERDGNLEVLPWLGAPARALVREALATEGLPATLQKMMTALAAPLAARSEEVT